MRILLAAHPSVGHTQALRAVGRELMRRGHGVDFATARVLRMPAFLPVPQPLRAAPDVVTGIAGDGFPLVRIPFSLRAAWAAGRVAMSRGYDELWWAAHLFTCDALASARLLAAELVRRKTDLVVHDYTYFGAWLAAQATHVPSAAVFHSGLLFPAPGRPPFGSDLAPDAPRREWREAERRLARVVSMVDRRMRRASSALGLGAVAPGLLTRPYSKGLNVLTTFEAFELPRPRLEREAQGPLLWSGPCLDGRSATGDEFPWERLEGSDPLVYVSLGTVFNDQPRIYRALLEGVRRAGARAIVAAGASFPRLRSLATDRDIVVRVAPQVPLLERVDLVIGHGGNNSTNETLRAGKPLLVLPFGAEQIANAQRVEALGVGRMLRREDLSPSRLSEIVRTALGDETRSRARSLSQSVPLRDGTPVVADALEGLVER